MNRKAVIGLIRASALAAALFLAGGAIPFVGTIVMLFAPAPIIAYAVGRPAAVWRTVGAVALAAAGVLLAAGPFALMGYSVTFGLATAVVAFMLERESRFESIVVTATAAVLVAAAAAALLVSGSPDALVGDARAALGGAFARTEDLYRLLRVGADFDSDAKEKLVGLILQLGPALLGIATAFVVLINLAVAWRWVGKQRLGYDLFGDLVRWSSPEWLVWLFIATGFALFIPYPPARTTGLDLFVCVAAVYFCQGLAVLGFYLKMLSTPTPWRGVIYFVAAVQPVLAALLSAVGIFDLWVDFRRLRPPSEEAGSFGDLL